MKTKLRFLRWLMMLMLSMSALGAWAQVGGLTESGDMTVCLNSTEPYGVVITPGSTYTWTIIAGTGGAGSINSGAAPNNLISVNWTSSGTCTLQVIETNSSLCDGVPVNILITVNPLNTIALSSAVGTNSQTVCINTGITSITYATVGATGATFSGLPTGVTGNWAANVVTISGTPSVSGPFSYTVTTTGGCGGTTATGTITVTPNNTVTLSSAGGTDAQTLCINTGITSITYATVGATGATFSGLPTGVTGAWAANVVTISGTPSVSGPFSYTVTLTGGCGAVTATGTIIVNPIPTTSPIWHN